MQSVSFKFVAAGALALAALGSAGVAQARDSVYWSVGVQAAPGVTLGVGNARPVYVQPAPIYVGPPPVYLAPRPVYAPAPVVYVRPAPVYYAPPVYYSEGWEHKNKWRSHRKHWKHHD